MNIVTLIFNTFILKHRGPGSQNITDIRKAIKAELKK